MATRTFPIAKATLRAKNPRETYAQDAGGDQHFLAGLHNNITYYSLLQFSFNWSGVKQVQSAYVVLNTVLGTVHGGFPQSAYNSGIYLTRLSKAFFDPNALSTEGVFTAGSFAPPTRDSRYVVAGTTFRTEAEARIDITALVNAEAPTSVKQSNGKAGGGLTHYGMVMERRTTSGQTNPATCVASDRHPDTTIRPYVELNYIPAASANSVTQDTPTGSITSAAGVDFTGTFLVGANQPAGTKMARVDIELYKVGGTTPVWSYDAAATPSDVATETYTVPLSLVATTNSKYRLVSGQGYEWRVLVRDTNGTNTAWSPRRGFSLLTNPPVLSNPRPLTSPSLQTLNNVLFLADYSDPDLNPLSRFQVQVRAQTSPTDPTWADDLLWDSGSPSQQGYVSPLPGNKTEIRQPYGGQGLAAGTYSWRIQAWDTFDAPSGWLYSEFVLTKGWEPDPGSVDLLTGYASRRLKARILIKGMRNNVQRVWPVGTPTAGTFKLTFDGQTTSAIAFNASAATLQAALVALPNINSGDISVNKTGTTPPVGIWDISFGGQFAGKNVPKLTVGSFSGVAPTGTGWAVYSRRDPGFPVAVIEDAANIGASEMFNSGGEFYFSLPAIHPQVAVIEPYQVHYSLEHFRGESWKEVASGIITDFDATSDDVVFYGQDYIALLGRQIDDRFNPSSGASADAAAAIWPAQSSGAKYVSKSITQIIGDQLDRSIWDAGSPTAFFTRGSIAAMDELINIFVSFRERLPFIASLIESHRAGRSLRTRLMPQKDSAGNYSWVVKEAGKDRPNIRLEYGGLVQGFRVIPFGAFSTRLNAIGRVYNQLKILYNVITPTPPSGANPTYYDEVYGKFATATTYADVVDAGDVKRRGQQAVAKNSRVGKSLALRLRPGSLAVKDGWDICDSVPVDIVRGVVDTHRMGSGLWTIWGWTWELAPTGEETLTLSVLPKEDDSAASIDLIPSEPVLSGRPNFQVGYGVPGIPPPPVSTNVALGKPVTTHSSSGRSFGGSGAAATNAALGDFTRIESDAGGGVQEGDWTIDLGAAYHINYMRIYLIQGTGGGNALPDPSIPPYSTVSPPSVNEAWRGVLQSSNDGAGWTDVPVTYAVTGTGENLWGVWTLVTPSSHRYWRIVAQWTTSGLAYINYCGFAEWEMYGYAAPTGFLSPLLAPTELAVSPPNEDVWAYYYLDLDTGCMWGWDGNDENTYTLVYCPPTGGDGGTSGRWEVLMASGVTFPPEPVVSSDGTDWLYGLVPGS